MAIFILTSALAAGLALTIHVFSGSAVSQNEIMATNLAREGIEVFRMARDTNWLESDKKGNGAWDLQACSDIGDRLCYPRAWSGVSGGGFHNYDIRAGSYRLEFDSTTKQWAIASNTNYNLYVQANGGYTHAANGFSRFARSIIVTENTNAPYTNQNSNSELVVKSVVGWRDKGCSAMTGQDPMTTNCKIVVEEHFTNWKDYK